MTVLILSSPQDPHAQSVKQELEAMGEGVVIWQSSTVLGGASLGFRLDQKFQCAVDSGSGEKFDLAEFKSVWLRRPGKLLGADFPQQWVKKAAEQETGQALSAIYRLLPAFWVNHPDRQEQCLLKLFQLKKAQASGFNIPETLITNEPEAVRLFYERLKGRVVYKQIAESTAQCFPSFALPRGIPTLPLRKQDISHLAQVKFSLHLFQEAIDKECDFRVTIIAKKIFAVRINSAQPNGVLDWRTDKDCTFAKDKLSGEIEQICLKFMAELGLEFGAIDLCLDRSGKIYFFEINPAGQFLWLEERLKLPISQELARILAQGSGS